MSKKIVVLIVLVLLHVVVGYLVFQVLAHKIIFVLEKNGFNLVNLDIGGGMNMMIKFSLLFGSIPMINHFVNKLLKVIDEKSYWIHYGMILIMVLFSFFVMYAKFSLDEPIINDNIAINNIPFLEYLGVGILSGIVAVVFKKFIPFGNNTISNIKLG